MNLVAKEFVAARDDEQGVLVLSQFTGAARDLTEALIVNPYDLERGERGPGRGPARCPDEQRERMRSMRRLVAEFNVYRWAGPDARRRRGASPTSSPGERLARRARAPRRRRGDPRGGQPRDGERRRRRVVLARRRPRARAPRRRARRGPRGRPRRQGPLPRAALPRRAEPSGGARGHRRRGAGRPRGAAGGARQARDQRAARPRPRQGRRPAARARRGAPRHRPLPRRRRHRRGRLRARPARAPALGARRREPGLGGAVLPPGPARDGRAARFPPGAAAHVGSRHRTGVSVSADDYPLGPALGFLRSVWRLNHAVELRSARMEATLGISAQQRMMLRCLGAFPGITAGRLATVLHLDPGDGHRHAQAPRGRRAPRASTRSARRSSGPRRADGSRPGARPPDTGDGRVGRRVLARRDRPRSGRDHRIGARPALGDARIRARLRPG
jgi:hypothetical protein